LRITSSHLATEGPTTGVEVAVYDTSNSYAQSIKHVRVEKVVVLGLSKKPSKVVVEEGKDLEWSFEEGVASGGKKDGFASVLTIKDPGVLIIHDWSIVIEN